MSACITVCTRIYVILLLIIIIVTIMIIIIIALKGTIRDFLQSPHCATNRLQHARSSGPGAIVCKSRASRAFHVQHVVCHMVRRDRSTIEFDSAEIAFILALFYWLKPWTDEGPLPSPSSPFPVLPPSLSSDKVVRLKCGRPRVCSPAGVSGYISCGLSVYHDRTI